jgi:glutamyl-Q tRNA(Asp) synthetase
MGSLLTAVASWLQARCMDGEWRLRIDDLDQPRCVDGADSVIQHQLEAHGLTWDGAVDYQSAQIETYRSTLETLAASGRLYACVCSRREIAANGRRTAEDLIYAGTCRDAQHPLTGPGSRRLRIEAGLDLSFVDAWRGPQHCNAERDIGDVIVRRADGIIGYHLACAVDEIRLGITEVVRGSDLLGSTFAQLAVMNALGLAPPGYRHGPLLLGDDGRKLSKQNHAAPVEAAAASHNLWICLTRLGIDLPDELRGASPGMLVNAARLAFRAESVGGDTGRL